MNNMFKIFDKYNFKICNFNSKISYISFIDEVELDIVTNRDALIDLQMLLQEHDTHGSYSNYPRHIQEQIDAYMVMKKLHEK